MNPIRAILVDDEESARDVLENLLKRHCPQVEVIEKCENVKSALAAIGSHSPDLVFLDIEMPQQSGFQLLESVDEVNFQVIFVTAYDQHAIRAFEVSAIDYLLKPIDIDRLKFAIGRVSQNIDLKQQSHQLKLLKNTIETNELKQLVINEKGQHNVIEIDDLIAFEAQEAYCMIHAKSKHFLVSKNLKYYERLLRESKQFIRVHKSWLVNTKHISSYSKSDLKMKLTNGLCAKISKYKRAEFEEIYLK